MLRKQVVRYARLAIGLLLIVLGVIGGFIPILQGWVFVLAGLTLMAPESRCARRLLDWAKTKAKGGTKATEPAPVASELKSGSGGERG